MTDKNKKKKKHSDHSHTPTYTGKLEIVRSGMGFVKVAGLERDILIHHEKIGNALSGDEVRVEITKQGRGDSGRYEGRVKEVLSRKQSEFSGRLSVKEHFAFLLPEKDTVPFDIFIPKEMLAGGKDGDRAIVRIVDWNEGRRNPAGEVVTILTNESENEIAMQGILMDAGFPLTFPEEVLEQAARYTDAIDPEEAARRKDLRGLLTFTIDPVDAKDFDDALSVKVISDDLYEIGVHIADVSYFVRPDTELDAEAYRRATSVYLPDRVLPMLPEHLSNQLCSLRPNEDKYAFSAMFHVNRKGRIKDHWLGRTIIRSVRRFTYEEVQEIIEGAEGDHKPEILLLNDIAKNLRAQRFAKGAINFSSQEVRFVLDEKGKPISVVVKESKEAHQLIEEFMLLANRTVAEEASEVEVKGKPLPFPYRVHDAPNEDKLGVFSGFASRFGYKLNLNSPEQIVQSFNEMLREVQGRPEQHVLESLGIRTMAKAIYTTENIGHYGLGFEDYCHFTSPIRRYPDVLTHRILQEILDGRPKPMKNLDEMCRHCSEQERSAMEAERAANKYKQVEFIMDYIGDDFEAVHQRRSHLRLLGRDRRAQMRRHGIHG